jgi:hypothetical protein
MGGIKVIVAVADFVASSVLVAVTVTAWLLLIGEGAVYSPDVEMFPTAGLIDHITDPVGLFCTFARNCCL